MVWAPGVRPCNSRDSSTVKTAAWSVVRVCDAELVETGEQIFGAMRHEIDLGMRVGRLAKPVGFADDRLFRNQPP